MPTATATHTGHDQHTDLHTDLGSDLGSDFELDISIVESGPTVADLMRNTDNGCGTTCQSACTSCRS